MSKSKSVFDIFSDDDEWGKKSRENVNKGLNEIFKKSSEKKENTKNSSAAAEENKADAAKKAAAKAKISAATNTPTASSNDIAKQLLAAALPKVQTDGFGGSIKPATSDGLFGVKGEKVRQSSFHPDSNFARKMREIKSYTPLESIAKGKGPQNVALKVKRFGFKPRTGISNDEYDRLQNTDTSMPERGTKEYYKLREKELRPIMEKIGKDADFRDSTYKAWADNYRKNKNWTNNSGLLKQSRELAARFDYYNDVMSDYEQINKYLKMFDKGGGQTIEFADGTKGIEVTNAVRGEKETREESERLGYIWSAKETKADPGYATPYDESYATTSEQAKEFGELRNTRADMSIALDKANAYKEYDEVADKGYKNVATYGYARGERDLKQGKAGFNLFGAGSDDLTASYIYDAINRVVDENNKELITNPTFINKTVLNIAQNIPQMARQTGIKAVGDVVDALTGGSGAGSTIANVWSAAYMYQQTTGGAYLEQLQNGLSPKDAAVLARNEGLASGTIELGLGFVSDKVSKGATEVSKKQASRLGKKLLRSGVSEKGVRRIIKTAEVFADKTVDTLFEGIEEGWQEAVSVTAENYSKRQDNTNPIKLLGHSVSNLFRYTYKDFERIEESAKWGAIVGGMLNVPRAVFDVAIDGDVRSSQTHKQRGENFIKSLNDGGVELSLEDAAEVLLKRSREYSENGYAAKNAKKLGEKILAKKEITLADLGKQDLYNRMEALEFGQYSDAVNRLNGTKVVTTDTKTSEGDSAAGSTSSQTTDGKTTNALPQGTVGSYKDGTITVDSKSQGKTDTLTHETGHSLEKTKAYEIYTEQLETTSAYAKCRQDIKSRYAAAGIEISDAQLRIETAAEMAINFAPDTPEKTDRLTRLANSNSQLIRNISNALRILTAKMKDKGKGKFVDKITGTELTYQEAVRLQILYENALIESGKTYSEGDISKINIEQSEVDKYRVKKYNNYRRKKFGSASYKQLQSAVMERNLRHYPNRKDVDYTSTANDFHVYQNVGDGFDVWGSIKIDGNEDIIHKIREGIDNGTIGEPEVFRKVHDELRNRERVDGDTGGTSKGRVSRTDTGLVYGDMRTGGQTADARGGFAESGGNDTRFGRSGVQTGKIKNTTTDTNTEYRVAPTPDNTDAKDYGLDVDRAIRRFSSNTNTDVKAKAFTGGDFATGVRDAFNLFNEGKFDEGHGKLTELGNSIADGKKTKVANLGDKVADYFEGVYKRGQYIKAADNAYPQFQSDMDNLHVNVPVYTHTLVTQYNSDTGISDMYRIEQKIREGMTALSEGKSGRKSFKEAAEILVESATNNDGTRKYKADEYKDAVRKAVDTMEEKFTNEQPANRETDMQTQANDRTKYKKDIEGEFRNLPVKNITEGEVKQIASAARSIIDYVKSERKFDIDEFKQLINERAAEITKGHKHDAGDIATMESKLYTLVRDTVLDDIGRRKAAARDIIKKAYKAADRDGTDFMADENFIKAKDELDLCRKQEGMITGIFAGTQDSNNKYTMSNIGKKHGEMQMGRDTNPEFHNVVDENIDQFMHKVVSDKEAISYALEYLRQHDDMETFEMLAAKDMWDGKYDMVVAIALLGSFERNKQHELAAKVLELISAQGTRAGQLTQSISLLYKMSPEGRFTYAKNRYKKEIYNKITGGDYGKSMSDKIKAAQEKDRVERETAQNTLQNNREYNQSKNEESKVRDFLKRVNERMDADEAYARKIEEQRNNTGNDKKRSDGFRLRKKPPTAEQLTINETLDFASEEINRLRKSYEKKGNIKAAAAVSRLINGFNDATTLNEKVQGLCDIGEYETAKRILSQKIDNEMAFRKNMENDVIRAMRKSDGSNDSVMSGYWALTQAGGTREDLQTHVDTVLDQLGMKCLKDADFDALEEVSRIIMDEGDPDRLINLILQISGMRSTATDKLGSTIKQGIVTALNQPLKAIGRELDVETNSIVKGLNKLYDEGGIDVIRDVAQSQLLGVISDYEARSGTARATTVLHLFRLMSPGTWLNNVKGNFWFSECLEFVSNTLAWAGDVALSKATGTRSVGFEKPLWGGDNYKAGRSRANKAKLEQQLNVNILGDKSKYGLSPMQRTFVGNNVFGKIGAAAERQLGYSLYVPDEFFKGVTEKRVGDGLQKLVDQGKLSQNDAETITQQTMKYRTFQDDSKIGVLGTKLKDIGNLLGVGEEREDRVHELGLGDIFLPYGKVAGNVLARDIEYSPVGGLYFIKNCFDYIKVLKENSKMKNITDVTDVERILQTSNQVMAQRKLVQSGAKTLTGGAIIYAGSMLFASGIISYNDEDDEYEINVSLLGRMLTGKSDGEAKQGDIYFGLANEVPLYTQMSIGASMAEATHSDMSVKEWNKLLFERTIETEKEQVAGLVTISSINRVIKNFVYADKENRLVEGLSATAGDAILSALPSIIRQTGNALDDYKRNPYKEETPFEIFKSKVAAKIPILSVRETVPKAIDEYGQEVKTTTGSKWLDFVNSVLLSGTLRKGETSNVENELRRLAGGSTKALDELTPSKPYKTYYGTTDDKRKYEFTLSGKNYETYSKLLGETQARALANLINSDAYEDMTDEEKVSSILELEENAENEMRDKWLEHLNGKSVADIKNDLDEYALDAVVSAEDTLKVEWGKKYVVLDGVNVEDVINVYEDKTVKKNGKDKKIRIWLKGSFADLTDEQKELVMTRIQYNPDDVTLPDDIKTVLTDRKDEIDEKLGDIHYDEVEPDDGDLEPFSLAEYEKGLENGEDTDDAADDEQYDTPDGDSDVAGDTYNGYNSGGGYGYSKKSGGRSKSYGYGRSGSGNSNSGYYGGYGYGGGSGNVSVGKRFVPSTAKEGTQKRFKPRFGKRF